MSFYDKKALVILTVLYQLIEIYYVENDKDLLKHRLQLLIAEYKIGLRKAEHVWIRYYATLMGNYIKEQQIEATTPFLLSLIFMVSEQYRMILKNPRRIVAWESVENFLSKRPELNLDSNILQYDQAEKINSLLFNDDLYCK
jgi:hypothetical protein